MRKIRGMIMMFVVGAIWAGGAQAQDTNPPLTHIEIFEYQTGTVIVRGGILVGTVSTQIGTVSVRGQGIRRGRAADGRNMGLPLC